MKNKMNKSVYAEYSIGVINMQDRAYTVYISDIYNIVNFWVYLKYSINCKPYYVNVDVYI